MLIRTGIRCRALPGLLDFRVCAAGQGPPRAPEFCVYAAGQEPAWAPGFLRILYTLQNRSLLEFLDFCVYAAGQSLARLLDFVYTLQSRCLPGLLDFRVCAAGQGPAWAPGFLRILYTLQNRSLLEFLDFCVYSWAGASLGSWIFAYTLLGRALPGSRIFAYTVYAAKQKPARVPGFLRIRWAGASPSS